MKRALLAALVGQLNLSVHSSSSAPASTLQGGFGHSVPQALTDILLQFCVAPVSLTFERAMQALGPHVFVANCSDVFCFVLAAGHLISDCRVLIPLESLATKHKHTQSFQSCTHTCANDHQHRVAADSSRTAEASKLQYEVIIIGMKVMTITLFGLCSVCVCFICKCLSAYRKLLELYRSERIVIRCSDHIDPHSVCTSNQSSRDIDQRSTMHF